MSDRIIAEQFDLTPAIRSHIENNVSRITERLPSDALVTVFVSEPAPRLFAALIKIHAWGTELVATDQSPDLYASVSRARDTALRQMAERRKRLLSERRKNRTRKRMLPPMDPELA